MSSKIRENSKGREISIFDANGLGSNKFRPPLHPNTHKNLSRKSFQLLRRKSASSNSGKIPVKWEDIEDLHEKWGDTDLRLIELAKEMKRKEKEQIEKEEKEQKEKKEIQRKKLEECHKKELNKKMKDSVCTVSGGRRRTLKKRK